MNHDVSKGIQNLFMHCLRFKTYDFNDSNRFKIAFVHCKKSGDIHCKIAYDLKSKKVLLYIVKKAN